MLKGSSSDRKEMIPGDLDSEHQEWWKRNQNSKYLGEYNRLVFSSRILENIFENLKKKTLSFGVFNIEKYREW